MKNKEILITIINYKCEEEVIEYCKNISKLYEIDKCFVAITNNLSSGTELRLEEKLTNLDIDCKIYYPEENLGYLNGCFFGVEGFILDFGYLPKWIVVSNTDIEILDEKFYDKFLTKNYEEDTWCVCPSVISGDGKRFCNPHYIDRIPLKKVNRVIKVFKNNFMANLYLKLSSLKGYRKSIKQESQYVYSAHGCYFMIRDSFYKSLDGEKYGTFLYSEESFIAEIILENNKKAYYDSELELIHAENLSTSKINKKAKNMMISNSMKYIKKRFYGEK